MTRKPLYVDNHTHRIGKRNEVWMMYCPQRGPDSLIYAASWHFVLVALRRDSPCPHNELLDIRLW